MSSLPMGWFQNADRKDWRFQATCSREQGPSPFLRFGLALHTPTSIQDEGLSGSDVAARQQTRSPEAWRTQRE